MRILGIDPGLHVTGYGVIDAGAIRANLCEAGVIQPTGVSRANMASRVLSVYNGIVEIIEQFRPTVLAVEQLYAHYKHPRTAILMGHARGVLLLAAAQKGLDVVSYNATQVKKIITGNGRAAKDQVQRTVQGELGLLTIPEPPDVADALAVALCHYYLSRQSLSEPSRS